MESWLGIATERGVVRRALKNACVVGIVLGLINHGDTLVALRLDGVTAMKIGLNFLVPYAVSTVSSVGALRAARAAGG